MDPYYIYVTLHLLECRSESFAKLACDVKWGIATETYEKFFGSDHDNGEESEYDCIEKFISNVTIEL